MLYQKDGDQLELLDEYKPALALVDLIRAYGAKEDSPGKSELLRGIGYWVDAGNQDAVRPEWLPLNQPWDADDKLRTATHEFRSLLVKFGDAPDNVGGVARHCKEQVQRVLAALPFPIPVNEWKAIRDAFQQAEMDNPHFLLKNLLSGLVDISELVSPIRLIHARINSKDEERLSLSLEALADAYEGLFVAGTDFKLRPAQVRWAMDRIWHSMRHPMIDASWRALSSTTRNLGDKWS